MNTILEGGLVGMALKMGNKKPTTGYLCMAVAEIQNVQGANRHN